MVIKQELLSDKKTKYKKTLKKRIEEHIKKLLKEKEGSVKSQRIIDLEEIKDAGIIVFAFNCEDSPFKYIRTEPLFFSKEKNFDVLLYGNKKIILISIKETIMGNNVPSCINSLKEYSEDVERNSRITDKIEGNQIGLLDYYKKIVGEIEGREYVLATQKPCVNEINAKAKEIQHNFCLWHLREKQNKIFIINEIIKGDEETPFFGHTDKNLNNYLDKLKKEGKIYSCPLTFMLSSSRYLKATDMSIPLSKQKSFNYSTWISIFDVDLMNWQNIEKETVYKNYINYGLDCSFIKCVEDKGDIMKNNYAIMSIFSKAHLLSENILKKIAKFETDKTVKEEIPKIKKRAYDEMLAEQAKERGESLENWK